MHSLEIFIIEALRVRSRGRRNLLFRLVGYIPIKYIVRVCVKDTCLLGCHNALGIW